MEISRDKKYSLHLGDCLEVLEDINKESIDLIFADPPYKLSNGGITCHSGRIACVDKGEWDKSQGFDSDYAFTKAWLNACDKVLKPNGSLWVSGTYHMIHSVAFALMEMGYHIINEIAWLKPNAPPNMSCRCFTASHELLIWAKKNYNAKHTFNYPQMKELNNGKQMRSFWEIPLTPKREKRSGYHPTQKPLALLDRCILAASNPGDTILDPFCGSGSTGVSAVKLGRKFIGIEIDEGFINLTQKRLMELHFLFDENEVES